MQPHATDAPRRPGGQDLQWVRATRIVILVAFLDLFMQFPVIAPYARLLGASGSAVGVIVAAYSGTNLIGNLVAGAILDRWGRRGPILFGLLATALVLLGYAFSETAQQLLVIRVLHGFTAAILTPGAFAILGDSARAEERAHVMGTGGAFIAVAAVIGPLMAGVLRDRQGPQSVFLLSAALILTAFLVFWYATRKWAACIDGTQPRCQPELGPPFRRLPALITSYLSALALTVGLGTLVTHLPIVLTGRGESATRIGLTFTAFAIVAMIAMASGLSRASDRFGRPSILIGGFVSVSIGMVVLWLSSGFLGSILGMSVFGLGFGVLFPAMTALTAESVGWHQRGKAFGAFYAVFSVGMVIGAIISGVLSDRLGEGTLLPYLISSAVALAVIPAIGLVGHRLRPPGYCRPPSSSCRG